MAKTGVLLLTYGVPWPLNSGARIRDFNLMAAIAGDVDITLCCFAKDEVEIPDLSELRKISREVVIFRPPERTWIAQAAAAARGVLERRPVALSPFFYPAFAAELRLAAERNAVAVFQVEHSFLAAYRCAAPANCRTILSFHNAGSLQYARMARLENGVRQRAGFLLKALLMRRWEARCASGFDHCLAVSAADAELLRRGNPDLRVSVVQNGVDCRRFQPLPEADAGNDILFTGVLGYLPNADGVRFFCREILPLVRREVPDVRLLVVGQSPPADLRALAGPGIAVTGDVADVVPYYRQARMSVVPLRAGGGTRLKILESMALGRAVVSTSIGCEGLEVKHGRDILIADTPDGFAAHVVSVLRDTRLRALLTSEARRTVEESYDWPISAAKQRKVYESLVSAR